MIPVSTPRPESAPVLSRTSSRRVAAGAAVGAIALSLAFGGAAFADDPAGAPTTEPLPPAPSAAEPAPNASVDATAVQDVQPAPADATDTAEPADTTPPTVTMSGPAVPPSGWHTERTWVKVTASDSGSGVARVEYRTASTDPWTTLDDPNGNIEIRRDGIHDVTARAIDSAGNVSAEVHHEVKKDQSAPYLARIHSSARFVHPHDELTLEYECVDETSGLVSCSDDTRDADGRVDTSQLGTHIVSIEMLDLAGNRRVVPWEYTVTDDVDPPVATVETRGDRTGDWLTQQYGSAVHFTASDALPDRTWYLVIDGVPATMHHPSVIVPLQEDGEHVIEWSVADAVGNATAWRTVRIGRDTVAPSVQFTAADAASAPVASGAVVQQGSALTLGFECTDATSGIADCTGEVASGDALDTSSLGLHTVLVTATDNAGHESSATFEYTVEEAPAPGPDPVPGGGPGTDPGTGSGGSPVPPTGPARPEPARPGAAAVASERELASTGAAGAAGVAALIAALITAGFTLTAVSRARRADR